LEYSASVIDPLALSSFLIHRGGVGAYDAAELIMHGLYPGHLPLRHAAAYLSR
jgi:hypothetical protein